MNNTIIKVCGVRNPAIAQQAALLGVNLIGLVFHKKSKRFVDFNLAKNISRIVKESGAKPVAVFFDHTYHEMKEICHYTDIQIVQLHGDISKSQHYLLPESYQRIYGQQVQSDGKILNDDIDGLRYCHSERDFLLFDNFTAGSGKQFDWSNFKYQSEFHWLLAGGLTAENVSSAIKQLNPTGVDVSSGVENGKYEKELTLIQQFIDKTRYSNAA